VSNATASNGQKTADDRHMVKPSKFDELCSYDQQTYVFLEARKREKKKNEKADT
jgi:hypothetical protein